MNVHAGFPLIVQRTHTDDLPRATIDVSAELKIGDMWIADVEAKVTIYREFGMIQIDDVEILGRQDGKDVTAHVELRFPTNGDTLSTLCAAAIYSAVETPEVQARADEAMAEAEREWRAE